MARDTSAHGKGEGILSIIGQGMLVVGDLTTEGAVRVDGRVEGNLRVGTTAVVGPDGSVAGSIRAHDAVVSGTVQGDLVVESRLEIHASARIRGDVRAARLELEDGAVLNGTLAMGPMETPLDASPRPMAEVRARRPSRPERTDPAGEPRAAAS